MELIKNIVKWESWNFASTCLIASFATFLPFDIVRFWLLPTTSIWYMLLYKIAQVGIIILIANALFFIEERAHRRTAVLASSIVFSVWLVIVGSNIFFGRFNLPEIVDKARYNGITYYIVADDLHFEPPWTTYHLTKWQALKSDSREIRFHGRLEIRYDEQTQVVTIVQVSQFESTEVIIYRDSDP